MQIGRLDHLQVGGSPLWVGSRDPFATWSGAAPQPVAVRFWLRWRVWIFFLQPFQHLPPLMQVALQGVAHKLAAVRVVQAMFVAVLA